MKLTALLVLCMAFALTGCAGDDPSAPPASPDPLANTPDATLEPAPYATQPATPTYEPGPYEQPAYTSPEYSPGSYPAPPPGDYGTAPAPEVAPGGASCGGGGSS